MKLVGERRALAAVVFAFYFLVYGVLVMARMVPPELDAALAALAGVYGLAFFALVAGYFWARWYAVGVGLYGVMTSVVGMWQLGAEPLLLFIGGTHLFATLALWGHAMSVPYDGQTAWREKFHMDDNAVQRLGRSVIRAGLSLPLVLLYALAPKPAATMVAALLALALTGLGIRALVQLKTWGVMALGSAGVLMIALSAVQGATYGISGVGTSGGYLAAVAGVLLLSAAAPFLAPMVRWFRAPARV
jgi:hypothetical protein